MAVADVKALTFDVFGTVVDYRSTIIAEGEQLNRDKGLNIDWATFADAWRGRYHPSMDRVMSGELPWMNLDALHRLALEELLNAFEVAGFTEERDQSILQVQYRKMFFSPGRR
jgi:2-haloacid dehalogenase